MKRSDILLNDGYLHPIVKKDGNYFYLHLTPSDYNVSLTWLSENQSLSVKADYSKLSYLCDVIIKHRDGYLGLINITYDDILKQIPKKFLDEAFAFEIIYTLKTCESTIIFNESFYKISIIRLYSMKKVFRAHPIKHYPTFFSPIPVNCSKKEFRDFKRFHNS